MSVAVSPYLSTSQGFGFAGGKQADLLDALLASCQKATMNPPLPGYGRTLQPYFATDPTPNKFSGTSTKQVVRNKSKSKKSKGKNNSALASSSSDEEANVKSSNAPSLAGKKPVEIFKEQTIKAVYNGQNITPHAGTVWAGILCAIAFFTVFWTFVGPLGNWVSIYFRQDLC